MLELKERLGFDDPRSKPEFKNSDICGNDVFRESWSETGVSRKAFEPPRATGGNGSCNASPAATDQESLIQSITDRVMEALAKR